MKLEPPAPFDPATHRVDGFSCGIERLDTWLRAYAGQGQRRDAARTYVAADTDGRVAGYYTLVAAQVGLRRTTSDVQRGMSKRFPIPVVLLARLAVDDQRKGIGLGAALLADAMRRTVRVADEVGIRAVMVDAVDDDAAAFYARFGFEAVEDEPLTLMATVAAIRQAASS